MHIFCELSTYSVWYFISSSQQKIVMFSTQSICTQDKKLVSFWSCFNLTNLCSPICVLAPINSIFNTSPIPVLYCFAQFTGLVLMFLCDEIQKWYARHF